MACAWGGNEFGSSGFGGMEIQTSSVTGVECAANHGTIAQRTENTVVLTGLEATGAVGSVVVAAASDVPVNGVASLTYLGDEDNRADAVVLATGVSADALTSAGWGEVPWGDFVYGLSVYIRFGQTVSDTNGLQSVVATASVNNVTVVAESNYELSGVEGTAALGDETPTADAVVVEDGVEATGAVGTVVTIAKAVVIPTGVEGVGTVGTAALSTDQVLAQTGLSATASLGAEEEVIAKAVVVEDGVEGTGAVGTVVTISKAVALPTGVSGSASLGAEEEGDSQSLSWTVHLM